MNYLWYLLLLPVAIVVLFVLFIFLYALTINKKKPIEKQNKFCRWAIDFVIPIFNWLCGVRLTVTGLEKLPKDEHFVAVSNHRSMFDPTTAIQAFKGYNVAYVSKPENFKLPLVGSYMHGIGSLPVDRDNDRQALRDILTAADYVKRGMCSMCIYPEGTRGNGKELLPYHAGSFKLAQRAETGLAIVATYGTENVKRNLFLKKSKVGFDVLEFIPADQVKARKASELAEYSMKIVSEHLAKMEN